MCHARRVGGLKNYIFIVLVCLCQCGAFVCSQTRVLFAAFVDSTTLFNHMALQVSQERNPEVELPPELLKFLKHHLLPKLRKADPQKVVLNKTSFKSTLLPLPLSMTDSRNDKMHKVTQRWRGTLLCIAYRKNTRATRNQLQTTSKKDRMFVLWRPRRTAHLCVPFTVSRWIEQTVVSH